VLCPRPRWTPRCRVLGPPRHPSEAPRPCIDGIAPVQREPFRQPSKEIQDSSPIPPRALQRVYTALTDVLTIWYPGRRCPARSHLAPGGVSRTGLTVEGARIIDRPRSSIRHPRDARRGCLRPLAVFEPAMPLPGTRRASPLVTGHGVAGVVINGAAATDLSVVGLPLRRATHAAGPVSRGSARLGA